ncbi:MutS protein msh4 [Pestalotiopsis sp. 9143b]|nr:MutS protein msh4 [Pestalotiopsis sp. 9143b]
MLKRQIEEKKENSQFQKLKRRRNLILQLHETLKQMKEGDMDDAALGSFLVKLQIEFAERMHGIESRGYEGATDDDESSSGQGSRDASSLDETLAEQ